jgi:uncharacterized protein YukE
MSLEGMDVDQAQRLAQQLNGNTQALIHITGALGALTEELSYQWRGPASGTFQQQWSTQYQGALSRAAQTLTDMHTHLVANIRQQVQASDTDPGGGSAVGIGIPVAISGVTLTALLGGAGSVWTAVNRGDDYYSLVDGPLSNIPKTSEWLDSIPGHGAVDDASNVLGYAGAGLAAGQGVAELSHHDYSAAGGDMVDATASLLKAQKDDPVAYLAGVDLSLIHKDYDLASQIDWSQGVPNPFDPGVFRNDYVPTFKELPGELVSNLAGVF